MSNRIDGQVCTGCGAPLLLPFNEFRACSICTERLKKIVYETKQKHIDRDKKKGVLNVKRDRIWMARRPLGEKA